MQARASCPGTNRVINPVDMFILKRRTWGRGLRPLPHQTMEGSWEHSSVILPSPCSLGVLGSLLPQGFPVPPPGTLQGKRNDHTEVCRVLSLDINSQVPSGPVQKCYPTAMATGGPSPLCRGLKWMLLGVKTARLSQKQLSQTSGQLASMNSGIFTFQAWKVPGRLRSKWGLGGALPAT